MSQAVCVLVEIHHVGVEDARELDLSAGWSRLAVKRGKQAADFLPGLPIVTDHSVVIDHLHGKIHCIAYS